MVLHLSVSHFTTFIDIRWSFSAFAALTSFHIDVSPAIQKFRPEMWVTVVLKLGPKPGVLLPSVKDKLTGEPITSFQVSWTMSDSDSPNTSYSGGQTIRQGIKHAMVPPEKYLLLTISARGYKKWTYHDPSDPSRPAFIRLQPGEEKELLVELEPQAPVGR